MAFNPNEHMMQLKGRDYLQVAWRLVWFREDHPDWSIDATALAMDDDHAVFKAVICDADGVQKCSGHGSESKRDFGDYLEKAETKAVGRALAMLGYGTQFAADELDEGERIVDTPIDRHKRGTAEAARAAGERRLAELEAKAAQLASEEQKAELRGLVNLEQLESCTKMYGDNWERMTAYQAMALIRKLGREHEGAAG